MATLEIQIAELKDADALTRLINRAFVAESQYIAGERINVNGVRDLITRGTFLIGQAARAQHAEVAGPRGAELAGTPREVVGGPTGSGELDKELIAGVYVEGRGESAHLGLVSVDPERQGEGFGLQIMNAAEAHCREAGYTEMELRFIDHRAELQKFYERCGFVATGRIEAPDPGRAKIPFHFVQMAKRLE
jgi:GNAT superfamily N-acetyltransferase